nr:hypothetical protein [Acholeplasmatales bacterium]
YLDDKSMVIREAASMLSEYDRSERAQMLRDARAKDELEKATIKLVARKEGIEETKKNIAKSMYLKGMNKDTIASIIDVDIKDIDKYLE